MTTLNSLETPALILDREVLDNNLTRMSRRVRELGVRLRPHVKTAKSLDVIRRALDESSAGITVSTLREADYFFDAGIAEILYAVGIAPAKLEHAIRLLQRGAHLTLTLDSVAAVHSVASAARDSGVRIPVVIELDVDGHRSGVAPTSQRLLDIACECARHPGVELRGVMTHAGESYNCTSIASIRELAERERGGAVLAAERLRGIDLAVEMVSVGSTPTAAFASNLEGVTEVRVGVYMFQDLVMVNLNVCEIDDIAVSTLVSVIGHQTERGWIITDGGWMALSRDRGTARQAIDQGFGLVRTVEGTAPADDLIVLSVNQEHGIIARRDGNLVAAERYPIGTLLRVLPNHACAMAAQHSRYQVVRGRSSQVVATWDRINGW